ncbi:MAG: AbrB/MazE/SpoVT family DNA-binding domain-containing protein [Myxococcota bacterium]
MVKCAVSEKGQVTIPKNIRNKLGLSSGTLIEFSEKDGELIGRKSGPQDDPVLAVTGVIKMEKSVDAYITE